MSIKTLPLSSLAQMKLSQLQSSIAIPPMYISIEGFELVNDLNAILYNIEIGIQKDQTVYAKVCQRRYSSLQELDASIRSQFHDSPYLISFPPKKILGNKDPSFIEQRANKLQVYLENLIKIPGVCSSSLFTHFFDFNPSDFADF